MREQELTLALSKLMITGIKYANKISKYVLFYKNYVGTRLIINSNSVDKKSVNSVKKVCDNYCL